MNVLQGLQTTTETPRVPPSSREASGLQDLHEVMHDLILIDSGLLFQHALGTGTSTVHEGAAC